MADVLNLAEQIRETELLKGEILGRISNLYITMANCGDIRSMERILGETVLDLYRLAEIIGVSPARIDEVALAKAKESVGTDDALFTHFLSSGKNAKGF